jgi:hypothetical protein
MSVVLPQAAVKSAQWHLPRRAFTVDGTARHVIQAPELEPRIMRYRLTDYEWAAIKPMLPNKPRGIPRVNDRRVLNGISTRISFNEFGLICRLRAPPADTPKCDMLSLALRWLSCVSGRGWPRSYIPDRRAVSRATANF